MSDLLISSPDAASGDATSSYDVAVIGGGPAGSTAAWRLAGRGRRVVVLERQRFPRFHIGESLLPASNPIFEALGLRDRMRDEAFVEKRGASFATEDGELASYIDFTACPDVASPITYQVPRDRFDEILLTHAEEAGAEVRQDTQVRDVTFDDDGVTLSTADSGRLWARVLLDASGQSGFLAKRFRLRLPDPELRNVALYAHFEGVARPPGERAGDIRIISLHDMGWIWLIPLSDTVTSIGIVQPKQRPMARPGEKPEETIERLLAAVPVAAHDMEGARRVSAAHYAADFSYASRAYTGPRWLLAGDAGSFLDPVFSTGVLLALESGLEAAEAIDRALGADHVRADAFAAYDKIQRRRYQSFRRMVRGFYDPAFRDLFFHPTNRFGLLDAIVNVLSGNWQPPLKARLLLAAFFGMVTLQRFLPLAPRIHAHVRTEI